MPEARQEIAAAQAYGYIFAISGLVGRANRTDIYSPFDDVWGTVADLPIPNDHAWAVSYYGYIIVGGGRTRRVFVYDLLSDFWFELPSTIYQHGNTAAAAELYGYIVVAGGTGPGMVGNEAEIFDPETFAWYEMPRMSCARNHTTGGIINDKFYVVGGRPGNQTCNEEFDFTTWMWTTKASMPTGRSGIAGGVVGECLYVFGGEGNPGDPFGIFHQVEAYNATTNTWTQLPPMRTGRHGIYAAVVDNSIFLPGGATAQGFGATDINDVYVVETTRRK